jgi:hypothetical protein
MKNIIKLFGLIALVAVIGFSFTACGGGGGDDDNGGSGNQGGNQGDNSGGGVDSNWKWTAVTDSTFGTTDIEAIAYGGDKFVAGGQSGKMAYSSDGESWTAVVVSTFGNTNTHINAIAYSNNKFVAVGGDGKMAHSTDGESWTAVADSAVWQYTALGGKGTSTAGIRSIVYGNNRFVAGGNGGRIAYSADGTSWTAVAVDNRINIFWAIAYGNGRFVIGGGGKTMYSADGVSWTEIYSADYLTFGGSDIKAIAYGYGRFVFVGEDGKMAYADWEEPDSNEGEGFGGGGGQPWGEGGPVRPGG